MLQKTSIEVPQKTEYIAGNYSKECGVRVSYVEYLKSPYWKAIRRRALAEAEHTCHSCGWVDLRCVGQERRLEVHHRTYDRLGCELPTDLAVLCDLCHAAVHDLPPRPTNVGMASVADILRTAFGWKGEAA